MKIVIFGLTVSSSWGNGHATLWRGLCRELAARGHTIVFFERDVSYYAEHRDLSTLPGGGELVLYAHWDDALARAQAQLAEADAALVTSYCPDGVAATELVLESSVRARVFYDLDTPVTLHALREGRSVDYLGSRGLRDFDLVLSYTGGRALDDLRELLGARRVAPLYGSVDPQVHHRTAAAPEFRADLSYLGTYAIDRQPTLERLLTDAATRLPRHRFVIAGAQYPADFPWLPNLYFVQHLAPSQHAAFYSSSRLTLNVTRAAMKAMGYCPSGRLFEAAACATPVLSDAWDGLSSFFDPATEILVAHDTDEAVAAISRPQDELAEIGRRARDRVCREHTAAHRAAELESLLAGIATPSTTTALA
jgi:spore maturation protein CgeB